MWLSLELEGEGIKNLCGKGSGLEEVENRNINSINLLLKRKYLK